MKARGCRKFGQLIREPIEKAIADIEDLCAITPEAKDYALTITPVAKDTSNIFEWLTGYLEIGLNGDFAQKFADIATSNEKKREAQAKLTAKRQAARAQAGE